MDCAINISKQTKQRGKMMGIGVRVMTDVTDISHKDYHFELIDKVLVLSYYYENSKPSKRHKHYKADFAYSRLCRVDRRANKPPILTEDIKNQAMKMLMELIRVDVEL